MTIKVTYNVTDVYMSQSVSPVYITVSYSDGGASGGGVWGSITGTLSNQTDLQNALNAKFDDPTGTTSQYLRGDGSLATFPALTGYVPYTGATTNVDLGEYKIKAGQVTLDTSPTGTAAVGTIRWNDTTGTSETTLKGGNVILKNGVDLVARVVNKVTPNTTLTKAAYQAVRISGAQGQRLAVAYAQANNDANSADTIGLVTETIATNQEGFIMTMGSLEGINTTGSLQGETWADGDVLYLSPTTAGALTNIKPTAVTGHIVVIGYVEYAHANNGKIYVKVMNGWELGELHDVDVIGAANNDGIFLNTSTGLWEHKSIATVLGYTPEQPLTFNSPLSRSVNAVSIPQATGSVNGFLSATDWTTFNNKQNALGFTPANAATTLTINGVTYDLSANRSWTIAAGISGSGAAGQVTYWTGASAVSGSNNLFWDNAQGRLGIGTNAPAADLDISKSVGSGGIVFGRLTNTNASGESGIVVRNDVLEFGAIEIYGSTFVNTSLRNRASFTSSGANGFSVNLYNNSSTANFSIFRTISVTECLRVFNSTGNLLLQNGGTFSDGGQRLQVIGDTLLRGSGATSATTALTVQNSDSTNLLRVRNDGALLFSNGSDLQIYSQQNSARSSGIGSGFAFQSSLGSGFAGPDFRFFNGFASSVITSGARVGILVNSIGFQPTSGTATYTILQLESLINQTGGANGITRGLYINPTLTAAADFRAIEVSAGVTVLAPSVTARASLRIPSGTAPTSPVDGDIWFDGTNIQMRIGGVTKTFTLI